jgi:hypothetical protein
VTKHALPSSWYVHNDRNPWYDQTTDSVVPPNEYLTEAEMQLYGELMAALASWASVESVEAYKAVRTMQYGKVLWNDMSPPTPAPISTRQAYAGTKKLLEAMSTLLGIITSHDL